MASPAPEVTRATLPSVSTSWKPRSRAERSSAVMARSASMRLTENSSASWRKPAASSRMILASQAMRRPSSVSASGLISKSSRSSCRAMSGSRAHSVKAAPPVRPEKTLRLPERLLRRRCACRNQECARAWPTARHSRRLAAPAAVRAVCCGAVDADRNENLPHDRHRFFEQKRRVGVVERGQDQPPRVAKLGELCRSGAPVRACHGRLRGTCALSRNPGQPAASCGGSSPAPSSTPRGTARPWRRSKAFPSTSARRIMLTSPRRPAHLSRSLRMSGPVCACRSSTPSRGAWR